MSDHKPIQSGTGKDIRIRINPTSGLTTDEKASVESNVTLLPQGVNHRTLHGPHAEGAVPVADWRWMRDSRDRWVTAALVFLIVAMGSLSALIYVILRRP